MPGSFTIDWTDSTADRGLTAGEYYRLRRTKKRHGAGYPTTQPAKEPTVEEIVDVEHLYCVYDSLRRDAGQAPGPDGVRYPDLGRSEVAAVLRQLRRAVLEETYQPQPGRKVEIPKATGGVRVLTIGNTIDRLLAKALNNALEPVWERVFLPCSYGFRPQRSAWDLLADLEIAIERTGQYVLAIDDVKKAFDNVNLTHLMEDHTYQIKNEKLLSLVRRVLRCDDSRAVGIDQGCPYSPTALNVRLHYVLDLGMTQGPKNPSLFRYADNLAVLCRDVHEGHQILHEYDHRLKQTSMTLKGQDGPPTDIRSEVVQLLGLELSAKKGVLKLGLGTKAWQQLAEKLDKAHDDVDPSCTIRQAVDGWITQYGPAFANWQSSDVPQRVLAMASDRGFREVVLPDELRRQMHHAWSTWQARRASRKKLYAHAP